mmetsp:Transcript_82930/g.243158  ORF Transcript_82930/g.243158 Transcript_82930/m.243158 type:complete len:310 (+) Transcript_82930:874-1803(+)
MIICGSHSISAFWSSSMTAVGPLTFCTASRTAAFVPRGIFRPPTLSASESSPDSWALKVRPAIACRASAAQTEICPIQPRFVPFAEMSLHSCLARAFRSLMHNSTAMHKHVAKRPGWNIPALSMYHSMVSHSALNRKILSRRVSFKRSRRWVSAEYSTVFMFGSTFSKSQPNRLTECGMHSALKCVYLMIEFRKRPQKVRTQTFTWAATTTTWTNPERALPKPLSKFVVSCGASPYMLYSYIRFMARVARSAIKLLVSKLSNTKKSRLSYGWQRMWIPKKLQARKNMTMVRMTCEGMHAMRRNIIFLTM